MFVTKLQGTQTDQQEGWQRVFETARSSDLAIELMEC